MNVTIHEKANRFRDLHRRDGIFVMPNAWDAGSAKFLAAQGFAAIATTSGGVNYSHGRQDYVYEVPASEMLEEYRKIAAAIDLPVSADLENGYGDTPETVAGTIRQSVLHGLVGGSIEDWTGDHDDPLYETALAVERIVAARQAADEADVAYTLTARCEIYSFERPDRFREAVRRACLYADAGADCIFVPGMNTPQELRRLVREVDVPVSVVAGLGEPQFSVADLAELGVRRVSTGGSLARACFGLLRRAARELAQEGTFGYTRDAIPDPEINAFFRTFVEAPGTS